MKEVQDCWCLYTFNKKKQKALRIFEVEMKKRKI